MSDVVALNKPHFYRSERNVAMSTIFYLNPLSITYLIDAVLVSILSFYFFLRVFASRDPQQRRLTMLLFATFFSTTLGIFLQFLAVSLHPNFAIFVLPWVGIPGATAMSCFVLFAFHFQRSPTAGKLPEIALVAAFACLIGVELIIALLRYSMLSSGTVEYRETWISVPIAVGFLPASIFFAGHLHRELPKDSGRGWGRAGWRLLKGLVWLPANVSSEAAAARTMFFVSIMPCSIGVVQSMRSSGLVDWSLTLLVGGWLFLLTVAGFALAYMNHVPEQSSFRAKLVGVTLTAVLLILSGICWSIGTVYVDEYEYSGLLHDQTSIRFEPTEAGGYDVIQTGYQFDTELGERIQTTSEPHPLPFEFPFYDKSYTALFPDMTGVVGFEHQPRLRDIQNRYGPQPAIFLVATDLTGIGEDRESASPDNDRGVFVKRESDRVVISWNRLFSVTRPDAEYTFQLVLYPTGVLDMVFKDLPDKPVPDMFLPEATPMLTGIVPPFEDRQVAAFGGDMSMQFSGQPHQGLIQFWQVDFMSYLNRIYHPVAYLVLASCLLVLIVFPRLFHTNLDRPLQQLIHGVQQILDGKLATNIEPTYRDEIGYLATSFNKMAKAQSELIRDLESKVAERTREATEIAARNARLEERNHLSQELHDAVSQTLFSANLIADTLPGLSKTDPEKAEAASQQIRRLNKDALLEMRQMLLQLRPEQLSADRFAQLMRNIKDDIELNHPISVSLEIDGNARLPNEVLLAFYRVTQEGLVNAAKHAGARTIVVRFENETDQALLSVSDDGRGFVRQGSRPESHGLKIMEERMSGIGGSFELQSELGRGSTITAVWFSGTKKHGLLSE